MDYESITDRIQEAVRDVLGPLVDEGTFIDSPYDVGTLAVMISVRFWDLNDSDDKA